MCRAVGGEETGDDDEEQEEFIGDESPFKLRPFPLANEIDTCSVRGAQLLGFC